MQKEKQKTHERAIQANKEVFDHLKVAAIAVPGIIYLLAMHGKLESIKTFMSEHGFTAFADSPKSVLEVIQHLDLTYIPGGAYSIEQIQDMQLFSLVALFIVLSSTLIYGLRSYAKHQLRSNSGSRFVIGSKSVPNSDYLSALDRLNGSSTDLVAEADHNELERKEGKV